MRNKITFFNILLFFVFIGISIPACSQKYQDLSKSNLTPINETSTQEKQSNTNNSDSIKNLFKQIEGTYQIQLFDENYKVFLSRELLRKINEMRKMNQDVLIDLDEKSKLFLPSISKINDLNFVKIPQLLYIKE